MKRSTNSENLIVVTAIAIAISLLASACGPGNVKTLKAKTGLKSFSDKTLIKTSEVQTEKEAIEELLSKGNSETPVDAKAAQDLASKLQYAKLLTLEDGSNIIVASLMIAGKKEEVNFSEQVTKDDGTIEFTKTDKENLGLSAKIIAESPELYRIVLTEKITNAQKVTKISEVSVITKLNKVSAQVTSKDEIILKMKDASISSRLTQVYVGQEKVESKANRIAITVNDENSKSLHYSLISVLSLSSKNSVVELNKAGESLKESFNNSTYKMSLDSGSVVFEAKQVSLKFVNNTSKEESNVLLTLEEIQASKDEVQDEDKTTEDKSTEEKKTTEEVKVDEAKASAAQVQEDFSSDFIADSTPIDVPTKATAVKPNFSNVTGKVTTTETAKKATTQNQTKTQTQKIIATGKTVLANDVKMAKALVDSSPLVLGGKIASGTIVAAAKNPSSAPAALAKSTQIAVKQAEKSRAVGVKAFKENLSIAASAAKTIALNATPAGLAIKASAQISQTINKAKTAAPKTTASAAKKPTPKAVKIKAEGI